MANPELEVFWGGCTWRASHRRYMRPIVESAVELAHQAIEQIGIRYHEPKKVRVQRCGNSYPLAGENEDARGFSLFVRHDDYRRHKAGRRYPAYVTTTVHELAHAARSERFNGRDLKEEVATEGIAYVTEDLVLDALGGVSLLSYTDFLARLPWNRNTVLAGMNRDFQAIRDGSLSEDDAIDKWFDLDSRFGDYGIMLGIYEVGQRLEEGHTIGDIIDWPAERILNL